MYRDRIYHKIHRVFQTFSKKIQTDFNGSTLTSDAGALLLRVLDKRIGWVKAASVVTIMCAVCEIVIDPMEAAPLAGPAS